MEVYALLKTAFDAHTMGIYSAASLLSDCGYTVLIASEQLQEALEKISEDSSQDLLISWLKENYVTKVGISYRLDPDDGVNIFGRFITMLKKKRMFESDDAQIRFVFFAGLKHACDQIEKEFPNRVQTFCGGETSEESLRKMGVPNERIPSAIVSGCKYDNELFEFGKKVIFEGNYKEHKPLVRKKYPNYGGIHDSLTERLDNNFEDGFSPLIRAHSGPYSAGLSRKECVRQFISWCKQLSSAGYLDILSIGTSQLSQSNFGENWDGLNNGGGVPVNSEEEYIAIREAAEPMLVRTYSATKNVKMMAELYGKSLNTAWNALSFWWFNELDGRGPNTLYQGLKEHIATIKYLAGVGKPVEANVAHHFAFRGCDDVTYIVTTFLAAKLIKKCGVKTFIFQNMLNTPRSTWGIQDLAKSRALLKLLAELEDTDFRVILQTRAGLDFFKPDIEEAKIQLAADTALMDDIDSKNIYSPQIIHVVSYSEALFLATPEIINDSIKITRTALQEYRELKKAGQTPNVYTDEITIRENDLFNRACKIIMAMEENIPDLYSPEGLYIAFVSGWFPVPELWNTSEEYACAKKWMIKISSGKKELVDHGLLMSVDSQINKCICNIPTAQYFLKQQQ